MKINFGLVMIVLIGMTAGCPSIGAAASRESQIVCSEDVIPDNMIVTATGTSPVCRGSCRARRIEPVQGSIMIICANQPVPKNYGLDSITTTPDCQCIGAEDNAYIIKKVEGWGERENEFQTIPQAAPTQNPNPFYTPPAGPVPDFRTGD